MSSDSNSPPHLSFQDPPNLSQPILQSAESLPVLGGSNRMANKTCRVCGDKALGYNFNVVTCESCKAFFRRNANRDKEFRCPFNNNCEINAISRRFCQKCRLYKCFEAGMKKEWIMTDEAKVKKQQKMQETKKRKLDDEPSTSANKSQPSSPYPYSPMIGGTPQYYPSPDHFPHIASTTSTEDSITIPKTVLVKLLTEQKYTPNYKCSCTCFCGAYPPGTPLGVVPHPDVKTVETQTGEEEGTPFNDWGSEPTPFVGWGMGNSEENPDWETMVNDAISSEFPIGGCPGTPFVPPSPQTPASVGSVVGALTLREQKKLDELIDANQVMKEPIEKILGEQQKPTLTDVINMTDIAIRRIIKMSKKITGFKSLCQEDQIALLKGSCTELMILRGVMTYDPEKDSWEGPGPRSLQLKCEVLKGIKGNVYEEHKRYLSSFKEEWRRNETVMLLLNAITLFNPNRAHIRHQEVVQGENNMYHRLLRRYLETLIGSEEAEDVEKILAGKLKDLRTLNDNAVRIFQDVNPKDVEPLLIEIFDLK